MIGIIGFANLRYMQYLKKYTDILDQNDIDYEVVYWNREANEEKADFSGKVISFDYQMETIQSFHKKIFGFCKYVHFLIRTIKKRNYEKLIILTSQTAVPLSGVLLHKYKEKYIYDYRDITKERFDFYNKLVQKLISNSYFTAISSLGFKKVIGESEKYVVSHNCSKIEKGNVVIKNEGKINISFWGIIRNIEYNKKLCDLLGNDDRFTLTYHGSGFYKEIENHCLAKGYKNIAFTGRYDRNQIADFAKETDILHCAYQNDRTMKNAMPVKAYDSIRYGKPIIVNKGSYLSEFIGPYNISYTIDVEDKMLADKLYEWYKNVNCDDISEGFDRLFNKVQTDDEFFEKKLIQFVKK